MGRYTKTRIKLITLAFLFLSVGFFILFNVFKENLMFFYKPSEIKEEINNDNAFFDKKIRVGGVVKKGSLRTNSIKTEFILSDKKEEIFVSYQGILPPLFREEQGVIAEGVLEDIDLFRAERLLTKHDENYKPPELKDL